jgi:hypothetical protein
VIQHIASRRVGTTQKSYIEETSVATSGCTRFPNLLAAGSSRHMHKVLEQNLIGRWPTWFNTGGDVQHTAMSFGFTHGDGCFDIVWRLYGDLEPLVAEVEQQTGHSFEILKSCK